MGVLDCFWQALTSLGSLNSGDLLFNALGRGEQTKHSMKNGDTHVHMLARKMGTYLPGNQILLDDAARRDFCQPFPWSWIGQTDLSTDALSATTSLDSTQGEMHP